MSSTLNHILFLGLTLCCIYANVDSAATNKTEQKCDDSDAEDIADIEHNGKHYNLTVMQKPSRDQLVNVPPVCLQYLPKSYVRNLTKDVYEIGHELYIPHGSFGLRTRIKMYSAIGDSEIISGDFLCEMTDENFYLQVFDDALIKRVRNEVNDIYTTQILLNGDEADAATESPQQQQQYDEGSKIETSTKIYAKKFNKTHSSPQGIDSKKSRSRRMTPVYKEAELCFYVDEYGEEYKPVPESLIKIISKTRLTFDKLYNADTYDYKNLRPKRSGYIERNIEISKVSVGDDNFESSGDDEIFEINKKYRLIQKRKRFLRDIERNGRDPVFEQHVQDRINEESVKIDPIFDDNLNDYNTDEILDDDTFMSDMKTNTSEEILSKEYMHAPEERYITTESLDEFGYQIIKSISDKMNENFWKSSLDKNHDPEIKIESFSTYVSSRINLLPEVFHKMDKEHKLLVNLMILNMIDNDPNVNWLYNFMKRIHRKYPRERIATKIGRFYIELPVDQWSDFNRLLLALSYEISKNCRKIENNLQELVTPLMSLILVQKNNEDISDCTNLTNSQKIYMCFASNLHLFENTLEYTVVTSLFSKFSALHHQLEVDRMLKDTIDYEYDKFQEATKNYIGIRTFHVFHDYAMKNYNLTMLTLQSFEIIN